MAVKKRSFALVAGGAGVIGRACALEIHRAGYQVLIADKKNKEKSHAQDSDEDDDFPHYQVDFTKPAEVSRLSLNISEVVGEAGLSALIFCVGEMIPGGIEEVEPESWRNLFETNVFSAAIALREFQAILAMASPPGRVVLISSLSAKVGFPGVLGYSASKSAMTGLVRAAAVELAPLGIRVNALEPTNVETPILRREYDAKAATGLKSAQQLLNEDLENQPIVGLATPEEIGLLAVTFADPRLKLLTGQCLAYDGGLSAGPAIKP